MTQQQAHELVKNKKAILIDVREEEELRESGLADGALWMPCSKMDEDEAEWVAFKKKLPKDLPLILYCRSGNRSGRVAEFLRQEGFETVNLGGFKDWVAAGLPVLKFA